jgi:hypothetical protein
MAGNASEILDAPELLELISILDFNLMAFYTIDI